VEGELARRYLPNGVVVGGTAFAPDSQVSSWVKVQCSQLLAELAQAIPQANAGAQGDRRSRNKGLLAIRYEPTAAGEQPDLRLPGDTRI
jgi:hypothetical protein